MSAPAEKSAATTRAVAELRVEFQVVAVPLVGGELDDLEVVRSHGKWSEDADALRSCLRVRAHEIREEMAKDGKVNDESDRAVGLVRQLLFELDITGPKIDALQAKLDELSEQLKPKPKVTTTVEHKFGSTVPKELADEVNAKLDALPKAPTEPGIVAGYNFKLPPDEADAAFTKAPEIDVPVTRREPIDLPPPPVSARKPNRPLGVTSAPKKAPPLDFPPRPLPPEVKGPVKPPPGRPAKASQQAMEPPVELTSMLDFLSRLSKAHVHASKLLTQDTSAMLEAGRRGYSVEIDGYECLTSRGRAYMSGISLEAVGGYGLELVHAAPKRPERGDGIPGFGPGGVS